MSFEESSFAFFFLSSEPPHMASSFILHQRLLLSYRVIMGNKVWSVQGSSRAFPEPLRCWGQHPYISGDLERTTVANRGQERSDK